MSHPFIKHVESHLGRFDERSVALATGISGLLFRNRPVEGSSTFMSLGLSHHLLDQQRGGRLRVEYLFACTDTWSEKVLPFEILADVCDLTIRKHAAPSRGTVISAASRLASCPQMAALYCTNPVYFPEQLGHFDGFPEPVALIWLVPISSSEAAFIDRSGWEAFEELLEVSDPDLLDFGRPPSV